MITMAPMGHFSEQLAALSLTAKLIYSILGVILIRSAFRTLERTLTPHFGYGDHRYRARKTVTGASYIVIFIFITILFEDRVKQVGFAVGLFGAGVVVALQDVIASLGGFIAIGFNSLYRVGDRIQVNETKGDVVDISVLRTTVMETGNWVSGDLFNGRIVHIPNSAVLKGLVCNYSQGFRFIWDEIKIRLTSGSDHEHAREMLLRVAKETVSEHLEEAQGSWKRMVENYRIQNRPLEPTVTLDAGDGSLAFSLSYTVDYTKRTILKDQLFTKIVDEVASSKGRLEWASSSTTVVLQSAPADFRAPGYLPSVTSGTAQYK
jgi:small-conductance mechanosensitive channel